MSPRQILSSETYPKNITPNVVFRVLVRCVCVCGGGGGAHAYTYTFAMFCYTISVEDLLT